MRRLLVLGLLLGGLAWWLYGRRSETTTASVTIGFGDGSSVTLDADSPELDRLLTIAAGAHGP